MKKSIKIVSAIMALVLTFISSSSIAAWWGTPGYEWALAKGLTSVKTQAQLNKEVTTSDFYSIMLKYLDLKKIEFAPSEEITIINNKSVIIQDYSVIGIYNGGIKGQIAGIIDKIKAAEQKRFDTNFDWQKSIGASGITANEYRQIVTDIDTCSSMITRQAKILTRDNVKEINVFLDLLRYRVATLLSESNAVEKAFRDKEIAKYKNVKFKRIFDYGVMPQFGQMRRIDFLMIMYKLLAIKNGGNINSDWNTVISNFYESGVIQGVSASELNLALSQNLKYSDMLTFMHRFEAYDFDFETEDIGAEEEEEIGKEIDLIEI